MRRAIVGLIGGVVIIVATVLMLEGVVSAGLFFSDYLRPSTPRIAAKGATVHDTLLGWIASSPAPVPAPVAGRTRVACYGDSYTTGLGVTDGHAWCSLLAARFSNFESVNSGQNGYGLDQLLLLNRRDGASLHSQMQVLALTDLEFDRATTGTYAGQFKPYFKLNGDQLVEANVPVPVQTDRALRRAAASRAIEGLRIMQVLRHLPSFDERRAASRLVESRWPVFARILDGFVALAHERGSTLVLAYLPTQKDIKPGDLDERRQHVADYAKEHGIPFIDLTAAMRAMRPDSLDLAFIAKAPPGSPPGVTGQYSNLGNAWAADVMARQLATLPSFAPLPNARHPE